MSNLFRLNTKDFIKGLVVAVLTPALLFLQEALTNPNFSFLTVNWGIVLNLGLAAGIAYLIKNLLSDDKGAVLGKIG